MFLSKMYSRTLTCVFRLGALPCLLQLLTSRALNPNSAAIASVLTMPVRLAPLKTPENPSCFPSNILRILDRTIAFPEVFCELVLATINIININFAREKICQRIF